MTHKKHEELDERIKAIPEVWAEDTVTGIKQLIHSYANEARIDELKALITYDTAFKAHNKAETVIKHRIAELERAGDEA